MRARDYYAANEDGEGYAEYRASLYDWDEEADRQAGIEQDRREANW